MVNFKHLATTHSASQVLDPRDIFSRLPKPTNIDDLHTSQAEILDNWFEHRTKQDTVIKLNTGGGKTIIGLLAAVSSSRELGRGSLYLVDNKQLAQQVYDQAKSLGIEAQIYAGKDSLNASFKNGESILIATYQALFNGRSAFGVGTPIDPIDVAAIIVDDAHSSFDTIRDAFTVKIQRNDYPDLFSRIARILREGFISIDLGLTFDDFTSGVQSVGEDVLEVPFWTWIDHTGDVAREISEVLNTIGCNGTDDTSKSLRFSWPLVKNNLRYCQAVVGRDVISISPILPLIDMFPTFSNASRRIYMSATFADDGAIVRTFGCSAGDMNIISPNTVAGVGRRMIIEIADGGSYFDVLTAKMSEYSSRGIGTVVLAPSFSEAEKWTAFGTKVVSPDEVENTISALREGRLRYPVAFANRYNGIDLPGDTCRLLVISGVPGAMSEQQKLLSKKMSGSHLYARSIAQRIEQAIGRGTRGSGDYCVVAFYGRDLCDWIKDKNHLRYFSSATRAQIECGYDIMKHVHSAKDLSELIDQGATNDKDYAAYLSEVVAEKVQTFGNEPRQGDLDSYPSIERAAFELWRNGQIDEALNTITPYAKTELHDKAMQGIAKQLAAQIHYSYGDTNGAFALQNEAHLLNSALHKSAPIKSATTAFALEHLSKKHSRSFGIPQLQFDVFISHASEDKEEIVRPLADGLKGEGLDVWYDDSVIKLGDSLRSKIDEGLAKSSFGILVVSGHFLKKMARNSWVSHEVDGLTENRNSADRVIIPIWHKVTKEDIMKVSPSLANISALNTADMPIEAVVRKIAERVKSEH